MHKDNIWEVAKTKYKIQQIKSEWDWLIDTAISNRCDLNILEIGCYDGGSSYYLSNYSKVMTTIDNNDPCRFNPNDFIWSNYKYISGDSHDPRMDEIFSQVEWDFVFIDGDHSYEGVKADFNNVLPYLRKNTPVAFHDVVVSDFHHLHGCYVGEFWNDLKIEYKATKFDEFITDKEWGGIGIVWT